MRQTAFAVCALGLAATAQPAAAQPAAAQPAPPTVFPLLNPPSQERHPGKVVFHQLVTPDLAPAKQFYTALFGWTYRDVISGQTTYSQALDGGRAVAALINRPFHPGAQQQPAWLSFFAVPDVDAAQAAAAQAGAKPLFGPRDIPAIGQEAVLADPEGAVFGVLASSSGDPADTLVPVGAWIWESLVATDPDAAAAFYQTLFNYDVFDLPGANEAGHLILAVEGFARVSVNPLPAGQPGVRPYWLGFIRVSDVDAAVAKVTPAGGRVLLPPRIDRHGGKIAIVADPAGAPVGLMEWQDTADAGAAK